MNLKVCGLREEDNVQAIAALHPQWMGFIFTPTSPRFFDKAAKPADIKSIDPSIKKVGVFVNESEAEIVRLKNLHELDLVQLHGDESPEMCRWLQAKGIPVMKVFRLEGDFDIKEVEVYSKYVEMFLFDTAGKAYGGNGVKFNWEVLKNKRFSKPFLLSGGIGPDDAETVNAFNHPDLTGVDVNSKFETAPGVKNVEALKLFQQQIA